MSSTHLPIRLAAALIASLCIPPLSAGQCPEGVRLRTDERDRGDAFGAAVALEREQLFVGAARPYPDKGTIYIYSRTPSGWALTDRVRELYGYGGQGFGSVLAVDAERLLAAAPGRGEVEVYRRSAGSWIFEERFHAGDPGDSFGCSLALDGDRVLVGSDRDDAGANDAGSAYVFDWTGTEWSQTAKLVASDGVMDDYFGGAVAFDGDWALVGSIRHFDTGLNARTGAVYVFRRGSQGWVEHTKLVPPDGTGDDYFGRSVALVGREALISASGSATAYHWRRQAGSWVLIGTFTPGPQAQHAFGASVSFDGTDALFGAPRHSGSGEAYLYSLSSAGWVERARLAPTVAVAHSDQFGDAVALGDGRALVGAPENHFGVDNHAGFAETFELSGLHLGSSCASTPNSTGEAGRLHVTGSLRLAQADATLHATSCPAGGVGFFFAGVDGDRTPFGDGWLCVERAGAVRLTPAQPVAADGTAELDLGPVLGVGVFAAGDTWTFQFLFSDPGSSATGLNGTDGLDVTFCL